MSDLLTFAELLRRPAWHRDAACREHSEVNFMPERGERDAPARAVCSGCLVRAECLEFALEAGDDLVGIWGGTSGRQRRHLRRERAAAAVEVPSSPLRARRLAAGLSQADEAAALGVTQEAVSGWERGKASPRAEYVIELERLLAA